MFKTLKEQYGFDVLRIARKYIKMDECVARHHCHLNYNHECIR